MIQTFTHNAVIRAFLALIILVSFETSLRSQVSVEKLSDGQSFTFLEGPVWNGSESLYFTDIPNDDIIQFNTSNQSFTKVVDGTSDGSNGLMFNENGNLVVCEGDQGRIVERNLANNSVTVLTDQFNSARYNTTNDLCIGINGGIYFTDPLPRRNVFQPIGGVYYKDINGEVSLLIDDMDKPNGVTISTDGKTLYVNDASDVIVRSYNIKSDGSLDQKADFATLDPTIVGDSASGADGMVVDKSGNLYVTSSKGVYVFDVNGNRTNIINVPETPSNCTFGGSDNKTLFITARTGLYSIELDEEGFRHPFDYPKITDPLCEKVLDVDFDNRTGTLTNYTMANALEDFGVLDVRSSDEILGLDSPGNDNWKANNRAGNGILEAHYPKGETGDQNSGFSFDKKIQNTEEAILEYKVYYQGGGTSNKFVLVDGGIMPGLGGSSKEQGIPVSCTEDVENLDDGFSCRLIWRRGRYINVQMKVPDENGSSDCDAEHRFHRMNSNIWYTYRQYVKLNTPGQKDGVLEMFVDGVSTFKKTDVMFRKAGRDDIKINDVLFHTFRIGGTSVHNDEILFDDIKVWVACTEQVIQEPFNSTPITIPGILEFEEYDKGGQGTSYNDSDAENRGTTGFRANDGVDITEGNNSYVIGWISGGEWLEYTLDIAETTDYDLAITYASKNGGAEIGMNLDDTELISGIILDETNGWGDYKTFSTSISLPQGQHVLRVNIEKNGANLDKISFEEAVTTSTNNSLKKEHIEVFPNPSKSGVFNLSAPIYWVISSLHGKNLQDGFTQKIDLGTYPKGVYLLRLGNETRKIFIE